MKPEQIAIALLVFAILAFIRSILGGVDDTKKILLNIQFSIFSVFFTLLAIVSILAK